MMPANGGRLDLDAVFGADGFISSPRYEKLMAETPYSVLDVDHLIYPPPQPRRLHLLPLPQRQERLPSGGPHQVVRSGAPLPTSPAFPAPSVRRACGTLVLLKRFIMSQVRPFSHLTNFIQKKKHPKKSRQNFIFIFHKNLFTYNHVQHIFEISSKRKSTYGNNIH